MKGRMKEIAQRHPEGKKVRKKKMVKRQES